MAPSLFLYGASEELSVLYFENEAGKLFVYKNGILAGVGKTTQKRFGRNRKNRLYSGF